MSFEIDRWQMVENALGCLGVVHTERIRRTRTKFAQASSTGAYLFPDFTLHNVTHSDNIILILATLQRTFGFVLSEREAVLLATSAYLHDLGMFFSKARWEERLLPDFANQLRFCPTDSCDSPQRYNLRGKDAGEQIRHTHNLLSAYWLLTSSPDAFDFDPEDRGYLLTLCRGHRSTDLKAKGCACYNTKAVEGHTLRIGTLTSLLRLADALDFFSNRTPKLVLEQRALDFLSSPVALEHWLRHYFVSDPFLSKDSKGSGQALACTLHFTVPMKHINGVPYCEFFRPLFEKLAEGLKASDLDADQYHPDFMGFLGISAMGAEIFENVIPGFRELPDEIVASIEDTDCQDVAAFLRWLRTRASAIMIVRDSIQLLKDTSYQLLAPLSGISASCELLVDNYNEMDRETILSRLQRIDSMSRMAVRVVRNYVFVTDQPTQLRCHLSTVNLATFLEDCVRQLRPLARERVITLYVDRESMMTIPSIRVDTPLFETAVLNLLHNAIKYGAEGSQVTVRTFYTLKEIRIEIINYGINVDRAVFEKIFQRGFRTHEAKAYSYSGTGIGLTVARGILRMLGGEVFLASCRYDEVVTAYETTFVISIPCPSTEEQGEAE